jgi:hypothetical protein
MKALLGVGPTFMIIVTLTRHYATSAADIASLHDQRKKHMVIGET